MKEYCVYRHTSPSGKVYIGITCQAPERRWHNGLGYAHQRYLSNAIVKYGWDKFTHEVLYTGLTREEACLKEVELIAQHKSNQREFGYNVEGGGINKIVTEETIRRLSESHKGKRLSEEQKEKIRVAQLGHRNPHRGEPLSECHRRKISEGLMGHVVTDETRQKLREINVGKLMSAETRAKISMVQIGRKPSSETVLRWKSSNKDMMTPVQQVNRETDEPIVCFDSTMDAFRATGVDPSAISKCCRGKRKSAGGYKWRYPVEKLNKKECQK